MLSAHQPFETLPGADQAGGARGRRHRAGRRRRAGDVRRRDPGAAGHGAVAVQPRRDRDGDRGRAVAQHVRRASLCLGICDKIVPGLLIGALQLRPSAGDLRALLGRCPRGIANDEKAKVRQLYAEGKVGRDELLEAEAQAITRRAPAPSTAPPTATR